MKSPFYFSLGDNASEQRYENITANKINALVISI
jgi:hypothetical protein